MQLNVKQPSPAPRTHEGAAAARITAQQALRRSIMACLLWEDGFYEDGEAVASRIVRLIPECEPTFVAACAFHARHKMKLRHVPLLIVAAMTRSAQHKGLVADLLCDVIERPDEITEFMAIYYSPIIGSRTESAQVKRGLARAFLKFDEYQLAKYNRDGAWKLRDVLFLSHSNPCVPGSPRYNREDRRVKVPRVLNEREDLYRRLVDGELATPDTWESALSGGKDAAETFRRLMAEKKLGALAFLRNLRNMQQAGIGKTEVQAYAEIVNIARVLPFRFIAAARAVPAWEDVIEPMMLRALVGQEVLPGRTALLIDSSSSMTAFVSGHSDITRFDAAIALAILLRELAQDVRIIAFTSAPWDIPPRRGFALREAILHRVVPAGTLLGRAVRYAKQQPCDRIIVITDEQSEDRPPPPECPGYVINVGVNQNGVGYGPWHHIDGWSEAVLDYIRAIESEAQ